jgi:hypothetical protein
LGKESSKKESPEKENFMPNEFHGNDQTKNDRAKSDLQMNDPQNIWRNQTTEAFKMSADQLRSKAQQRQSKARLEAIYSILAGLVLFAFFARTVTQVHDVVPRIGFAVLSLWGIYFACQAYKWIWARRSELDATVNTTLQAYRSELEKRRDYVRHIWQRAGLTFCSLGAVMVVTPALLKWQDAPRMLANWAPVYILLAVWLAVFFPMRRRRQQKLNQEIDELRGFEREGRA